MPSTSIAWITGAGPHIAEQRDLAPLVRRMGCSQRQSRMSGWMPIARSSRTECCVGLVFISPAVFTNGSSVRWTKQAWPRGSSWPSWRMASKKGRPSMSPTCAADLDQHEVGLRAVFHHRRRQHELFDFVGDVRDHLDRRAEVVPAPLLLDDVPVDLAGGDVVAARGGDPGEPLVVAEVEVGLAPSSVTNTSPCWVGLIVPGSTFRYGSSFRSRTL
jgi:hypothetical protein